MSRCQGSDQVRPGGLSKKIDLTSPKTGPWITDGRAQWSFLGHGPRRRPDVDEGPAPRGSGRDSGARTNRHEAGPVEVGNERSDSFPEEHAGNGRSRARRGFAEAWSSRAGRRYLDRHMGSLSSARTRRRIVDPAERLLGGRTVHRACDAREGELAQGERALGGQAARAQALEVARAGVLRAVDDPQVLAARGTSRPAGPGRARPRATKSSGLTTMPSPPARSAPPTSAMPRPRSSGRSRPRRGTASPAAAPASARAEPRQRLHVPDVVAGRRGPRPRWPAGGTARA